MHTTDFIKTLGEHDLKVTEARKFLLTLIEKQQHPVDAQFLIDTMQKALSVDRVTVFRILNTLTDHGILRKIEFGEGKARYELNNEDHHHLICENCGKIEDVSDCDVPGLEKEIMKKKSFLITRHTLEFFGLCEDCQNMTKTT